MSDEKLNFASQPNEDVPSGQRSLANRDGRISIGMSRRRFLKSECEECGEEYIQGIYCRCNEHEFFDHDGKG